MFAVTYNFKGFLWIYAASFMNVPTYVIRMIWYFEFIYMYVQYLSVTWKRQGIRTNEAFTHLNNILYKTLHRTYSLLFSFMSNINYSIIQFSDTLKLSRYCKLIPIDLYVSVETVFRYCRNGSPLQYLVL